MEDNLSLNSSRLQIIPEISTNADILAVRKRSDGNQSSRNLSSLSFNKNLSASQLNINLQDIKDDRFSDPKVSTKFPFYRTKKKYILYVSYNLFDERESQSGSSQILCSYLTTRSGVRYDTKNLA